MENHPLVTIQILNWNRADETLRAIKSAKAQTYPNCEIVVIDNGSTDNSIEKIEHFFPQVKLVKLDKNYGCPGGRNRGIKSCSGDFIFFCDNDGVLHSSAVENAMKCLMKNPDALIVTGLVKDFISEDEINTRYFLPEPNYSKTNLFQGGITLHKRFIFEKISMYPDDYIYGGEETYLAMRVLDAGYSIIKCNEVVLWHKKSNLARNVEKESLQAWGNKLVSSYQLYPLKYFLIFFLYFFSFYPFYALKYGFIWTYLRNIPLYLKRLNNYKRNPVSKKTFKYFSQFK